VTRYEKETWGSLVEEFVILKLTDLPDEPEYTEMSCVVCCYSRKARDAAFRLLTGEIE
jgi:hypothetical protein